MPEVSVIIPVYNGAPFIADAVRTVLDQQEVDLKVIVIDDGSADETPNILAEFADRIHVVRQPNAGHIAARNRAAEMADSEWLAFLDADDQWDAEKLRKQLDIADEQTAMVYTERQNIGECERVARRQSDTDELTEGDLFEPLL